MSIYLQIAIGLAPVLVIFAVLAIAQKKGRLVNLISAVTFLAAVATMTVLHFAIPQPDSAVDEVSGAELGLVYAAANEEGGQDLAKDLLKAIREEGGDAGELALCDALIHAASGDVTAAKALYLKADSVLNLKDDQLLELCNQAVGENGMMNTQALEELKTFAAEQIEARIPKKVYSETAHAMLDADQVFEQYLSYGYFDEEQAREDLQQLSGNLKKYSDIGQISQVRLMRMKLNVLLGNYKTIAQSLTEDATYEELAIVSELYMAGFIKESSFSDEYAGDFSHQAKVVEEQLDKVAENMDQGAAKKSAKTLVKRLKQAASRPSVYKMVDGISSVAADVSSTNRSKAYLQLAKFEFSSGNSQSAEAHITSSLETIGLTDDDNYFVPMSNLVQIITDKDDPEKLKQIATYVDEVTTHSADEMVIKVVEEKKEELPPAENEQTNTNFDGYMTDTLNQTRITLDITHVDSTKFDTVTVTVNIDDALAANAAELKDLLVVTDCGVPITDFTVEKVEFTASNILLCCDVSGSMGGQPIQDLRNAVIKFLETSPEKENVALVTFASSVKKAYGFDTSAEELMSAAESIRSGGGTNMYDAIIRSLQEFNGNPNEVCYILLLSDGQDGNRHEMEDMQIDIGTPAQNAGIILYSLGLGDGVDSAYMSGLATVTGGDYLHVTDSETLATFYNKLRNQAMNRYKITFKAEDTMSVKRNVKVAHKDKSSIVNDIYYYSIGSDVEDGNQTEYTNVSLSGKSIRSLSTNLVYQSIAPTTIQVYGEGFAEDDSYSVKLSGSMNFDSIPCTFVDGKTLDVVLPGGLAKGEYDLRITINGRTAVLINAIQVVVQDDMESTPFGPYVFTSYSKVEGDGITTLDNHVVLNGWLSFKGDVTLRGDLESQSIYLVDYEGCYVRYNTTTGGIKGFAKLLAERGESLQLGALGSVELINDRNTPGTSDDYPTVKTVIPELILPNLLWAKSPSMELYPHKIVIDLTGFSTDLPFQDVVMKYAAKDLFEFDVEASVTVSNNSIDLKIETEMGTNPKDGKVITKVGKVSVPVYKGSMKLKLDTSENLFSIDMEVEIPALFKKKDTGFGLKLEWKARDGDTGAQKLCPSTVMFKVDVPINVTIGGVPVTLDDFQLGMEDIDPNKSILDWMLVGSMDLGLSKVSDYLPGLDDEIGDVSLLKLDDAQVKLSWGQQYIGLETKITFLDEITLGQYKIEAGRIPFTVVLLDMYDVEAYGFKAESTQGFIWDTDKCDVNVSGTGKLSANPKLFAMEYKGQARIDIEWWILDAHVHKSGTAMVAFYTDQQSRFNFALIARYENWTGTKDYYLTWNKDTKLQVGSRKV